MRKEIIDITPPTEEEIVLELFRRAWEEDKKAMYVLNLPRYNEMQRAIHLITKIVRENDPDAKIETGFCELYRGHGRIVIETWNFGASKEEMPELREVMNLASNFDVLPLTEKDRLRCGFIFHDVMIRKT